MRIQFDDMLNEFKRVLIKKGLNEEDAYISAKLFAENSLDGVYSHGINRFSRVISYIDKGYIDVNAKAEKVDGNGCFERWDGNRAIGNVNAKICMDRAIELAKNHGVGLVAIKNTNHWMRGGAYGWQAADAGCVGICWTNTMPNMPAWGAKDRKIGNNPFIMAIPRSNGEHVVIDSAMSQFSYGKIEEHKLKGTQLPWAVGRDEHFAFTALGDKLKGNKQLILSIVIHLLSLIFTIAMAKYGFDVTLKFWNYTWANIPTFKMRFVWMSLPITGISMSFYLIMHVIEGILLLKKRGNE